MGNIRSLISTAQKNHINKAGVKIILDFRQGVQLINMKGDELH